MTLDSLLAHIPAWREFFVDQWEQPQRRLVMARITPEERLRREYERQEAQKLKLKVTVCISPHGHVLRVAAQESEWRSGSYFFTIGGEFTARVPETWAIGTAEAFKGQA